MLSAIFSYACDFDEVGLHYTGTSPGDENSSAEAAFDRDDSSTADADTQDESPSSAVLEQKAEEAIQIQVHQLSVIQFPEGALDVLYASYFTAKMTHTVHFFLGNPVCTFRLSFHVQGNANDYSSELSANGE